MNDRRKQSGTSSKPAFTAIALIQLLAVSTLAAPVPSEVTLEQIISREDPAFNCSRGVMAVGRDGRVYLASGGKQSFVLRVSPEGKEKFGAVLTDEAISGATANAQGVLASAHAHFAARVSLPRKSQFFRVTAISRGLRSAPLLSVSRSRPSR